MQKLFIILLLPITIICQEQRDVDKYEIQGNIKEIKQSKHQLLEENGQYFIGKMLHGWGRDNFLHTFNTDGNYLRSAVFEPSKNDSISFVRDLFFFRQEDGKLIEKKGILGNKFYHLVFHYQKNDIHYTQTLDEEGAVIDSSFYKYRKGKHIITERYKSSKVYSRDSITYFKNKNQGIYSTYKGEPFWNSTTNKEGKNIKLYQYFDKLIETTEYDNKGRIISSNQFSFNDSLIQHANYTWINDSTCINKRFKGNDLQIHISLHYKNGNLVKVINYLEILGVLNNESTYTYIFDNKGNWIEQKYFVNNIPKVVMVREIKYF